MYDDDLFSMLNSYTATDTEKETEQQTADSQQNNIYQTNRSPYYDDYSTNQNYEEETSYNSQPRESGFAEQQQTSVIRQMDTPMVQKQEPAVNLIKNREKLYISPRLKVASVVFAIIFAAIVFATVWNFALAGSLQASFAGKQAQINEISQSINELRVEYNELANQGTDDFSGYVEKVEGVNTFTVSLDDFYTEPEIEKIPSNWFNDVCEFFSQLFA